MPARRLRYGGCRSIGGGSGHALHGFNNQLDVIEVVRLKTVGGDLDMEPVLKIPDQFQNRQRIDHARRNQPLPVADGLARDLRSGFSRSVSNGIFIQHDLGNLGLSDGESLTHKAVAGFASAEDLLGS